MKERICSYGTGVIFKTILCGGITIALNIIVVKGVILFAEPKQMQDTSYGLIVIAFILAAINYIVSAIYRKALWRIIPCCNKYGSPVTITQILRYLIIFALTFAYSLLLA